MFTFKDLRGGVREGDVPTFMYTKERIISRLLNEKVCQMLMLESSKHLPIWEARRVSKMIKHIPFGEGTKSKKVQSNEFLIPHTTE